MIQITVWIPKLGLGQVLGDKAHALGGRCLSIEGALVTVCVPQHNAYKMRTYAATVGNVMQEPPRQAASGPGGDSDQLVMDQYKPYGQWEKEERYGK